MTAPDLTRSESSDSGVHYWILRGPAGVVTFGRRVDGTCSHVEIHSAAPMWEYQDRCVCEYLPGGCYAETRDGGGGRKIAAAWEEAGYDDALIWSELEVWYNLRLRDNPRLVASMGGAK